MFTSFYFSNEFLLFHTVRSLGRWVTMRYSGALRWCITLVRNAVGRALRRCVTLLGTTTCVTVRYSAISLHRVCRQR